MPRSKAKALNIKDYQELAEFRYLLRNFLAFSEEAARKAGLAPQQHQALLAVKGFPGDAPPSMGELAQRLGIRHHSAVGLVDRLTLAGWLRRTTDSVRGILEKTRGDLTTSLRQDQLRDALGRALAALAPSGPEIPPPSLAPGRPAHD